MTQQSASLIKTLEKIGAPLAAAVEDVSQRTRADMDSAAREVEDAKVMAHLLGQTVQLSLSLGGALVQATDEEKADALRLAVASMVAPIIAHYYRQNGEAPDDAALGRIQKSLEASIAFAENFNPAPGESSRLAILGEDTLIFDNAQKNITALDALVPVVKAIGEFPFGHSETKLLQDVSAKLKEKAVSMNQGGDTLSEMVLLKSLAKIYADCHLAEVQKLSQSSSDEDRGELSIDPVWQAFDTRLAMVQVLLGMTPSIQTASSDSAAAPAPVSAAPPAQAPTTPVQQATPAQAPAAGNNGNPMSFFSSGGGNVQSAAPVTPSSTQATAAPSATPSVQESAMPQSSVVDNSNPMSFFRPGAKKNDQTDEKQEA